MDIFAGLPSCSQSFAKNVLWVDSLVDSGDIELLSYQIDQVTEQIEEKSRSTLQEVLSTEIFAERISLEIIRAGHRRFNHWPSFMRTSSDELHDRIARDKHDLIAESLFVVCGPRSLTTQLQQAVRCLVEDHAFYRMDNEELAAAVNTATIARNAPDVRSMSQRIEDVVSWQDNYKIGGADPVAHLFSLAQKHTPRVLFGTNVRRLLQL